MLWMKSKVAAYSAAAVLSFYASNPAFSDEKLTAGVILERMNSEERFAYMAGIVEGLAYARRLADGGDRTGEGCLFNWFYRSDATTAKILEAFRRYPQEYAAPIILTLSKRTCGG